MRSTLLTTARRPQEPPPVESAGTTSLPSPRRRVWRLPYEPFLCVALCLQPRLPPLLIGRETYCETVAGHYMTVSSAVLSESHRVTERRHEPMAAPVPNALRRRVLIVED